MQISDLQCRDGGCSLPRLLRGAPSHRPAATSHPTLLPLCSKRLTSPTYDSKAHRRCDAGKG
eukprot:415034-Amorphochlora_amoeboformis.AAC.2